MANSLTIREGAATPLDFRLTYIDDHGQEVPYSIGDNRVVAVFVDKDGYVRKVYDSAVENVRMMIEPDQQTGVVRVFPRDEKLSIRASWSPYKVFCWVGQAAGWPHSFPADSEFVVQVLPSYGTHDMV